MIESGGLVSDTLEVLRKGVGPVHFMGVGGAGMCALAELLVRSGLPVTGCDLKKSGSTEALEALGVRVAVGHDASHVDGVRLLVHSSAVPNEHPELVACREAGSPVVKRAVALGAWVSQGRVAAVAGTHGKTTTTAMLTEILAAAGQDPTGLVGGHVSGWSGNLRHGHSDLFAVEADEYDRSFLTLFADVAIITNLEADHLDIYGDLSSLRQAFKEFVSQVKTGGRVLVCGDDHGASALVGYLGERAYTYGLTSGTQLRGVPLDEDRAGNTVRVYEDGVDVGVLSVPVPGLHNLRNALGAAGAARFLGADWASIQKGLQGFEGVARRFDILGEVAGIDLIDDYAHHHTEIEATLTTVRATYPGRRMVAVFQPHLFSRTRDFATELGIALAQSDVAWIAPIFPAREESIPGVTSALVTEAVEYAGGESHLSGPLDELVDELLEFLKPGDVCVTLGAGSIGEVPAKLAAKLGQGIHA